MGASLKKTVWAMVRTALSFAPRKLSPTFFVVGSGRHHGWPMKDLFDPIMLPFPRVPTGPIPVELARLSFLRVLMLGSNKLSGE